MTTEENEALSLWGEAELLGGTIDRSTPEGAEIGKALDDACRDRGDRLNPDPPDGEVLRAAIERLTALPAERRRQLLNGWAYDGRAPEEDIVLLINSAPRVPCLWITAPVMLPGGVPEADHRYVTKEDDHAVNLCVRFGARQAEVLECLDWLRAVVERDWERLITDPLDGVG